MNIVNRYATHLEILATAIDITDGPVVELGMGHASTCLINSFSFAAGRECWSLENEPNWFRRFKNLAHHHHSLVFCDATSWLSEQTFITNRIPKSPSVLLVDHAPHENRLADALLFKPSITIIHDTQLECHPNEEDICKAVNDSDRVRTVVHKSGTWTTIIVSIEAGKNTETIRWLHSVC